MKDSIKHWDKAHLEAFILHFGAKADLELSTLEEKVILDHVGEKIYSEVKSTTCHLNDFECIQVIQELKDRLYPGKEGSQEIMELLKEITAADGVLDQMEQNILLMFKKLL